MGYHRSTFTNDFRLVSKIRWRISATCEKKKNKSYVGDNISYVGLTKSYVGLGIFYVGLTKYYVGLSISYVVLHRT